jgi:spore germination cell wall hydrolase CwlJ-like protein
MVKTENILGLPIAIVMSLMLMLSASFIGTQGSVLSGFDSFLQKAVVSIVTSDTAVADPTKLDAIADFRGGRVVDTNELKCMTDNIYYEAATQSTMGKIAVGRVVLNRIKDPRFPKTVCGVVYQGTDRSNRVRLDASAGCQFSWTCDSSLQAKVYPTQYEESRKVAYQLLAFNSFSDTLKGALYYHADYINPFWSNKLKPVAKIDNHIFYVER